MKFDEIHKILNIIAPEQLQENWDNSGIQICVNHDTDIKKILTCLEINEKVIVEAVEKKIDMIVTHHPLIFGKFSNIDYNNITGNNIISLISKGISVYSSHTAFDSALNGTNQYLAESLNMENITPMIPADIEGCGMGRFGEYKSPINLNILISKLLKVCGKTDLRIAGTVPDKISKIGLCTGAGAEFIELAAKNDCDVYITGDVKYHDARLADDISLCVIDAGHYGTEVIFAENMALQLQELLSENVKVVPSATDIYPFKDTTTFK